MVLLAVAPIRAAAQELEPRAYSPSPTGANFLVFSYARSTGDVIFDPSLPFSDVKAEVNGGILGYGRTFGLFGRSASAAVLAPWAWGTMSGNVGEQFRSINRSGPADLRARLTFNLLGGPALTPREFAQRHASTALGTSLVVIAPTGEYDSSKLINISANRWAVKPELGLSQPVGLLTLEVYAGVWLYTDNTDFYGGSLREQSPLASYQGHVAYTFKPKLWVAGDANFYSGGRTTLDGVEKPDRQHNSRFGLTLSAPIDRVFSLKVSWATGVTARVGGDFDTLGIVLQALWF